MSKKQQRTAHYQRGQNYQCVPFKDSQGDSFKDLLKESLPQKEYPGQEDLSLWHSFKKEVKPLVCRGQKRNLISQGIPLNSVPKKNYKDFSWGEPPKWEEPPKTVDSLSTKTSCYQEDPPTFQNSKHKRRLRRRATPEATLDLHGMTQKEAFQALYHFIRRARLHGTKTIRVITGKGSKSVFCGESPAKKFDTPFPLNDPSLTPLGVLRQALPSWLRSLPLSHDVSDFTQARPNDGGEGAWYLFLR